MKSYVMTVLEEETAGRKGLYGLHIEEDGEAQGDGAVRGGLADALYWLAFAEGQVLDGKLTPHERSPHD
jgi:hypothetical protein